MPKPPATQPVSCACTTTRRITDTELSVDDPNLYAPEKVNPDFPTDTSEGDVEAALRDAEVVVDETYTTPHEHNNPMEPHATIAIWEIDGEQSRLTLYDSTQGVHAVRQEMASVFGLDEEQIRVVAKNVGGGFGSKGGTAFAQRPRRDGRETRRGTSGEIGSDATADVRHRRLPHPDHPAHPARRQRDGTITASSHDVVEQTATVKEYAEQTATPTRMMYGGANRATSHRLAELDVAVPFWMRAPGECPGMFGLEVAMDELAVACGIDPIELRIRNEPDVDPESGNPWSDRRLVECLQTGAERFGWAQRDPTPGTRRDGEWLVGTGVGLCRLSRDDHAGQRRPHRGHRARSLRRADRRRRHRHRHMDGVVADRR